jgi:flagellin
MSSILTNSSSMVALQTLKGINKGMAKVQDEISTGLKVATAKDNGAVWSIAQTMRSDVSSLTKVEEALSLGSATVGTARTAAESISDMLALAKEYVLGAGDLSNTGTRTKLAADLVAVGNQIADIVASASFNGVNLVDGTSTTAVEVVGSITRDTGGAIGTETVSIARQDLSGIDDVLTVLTAASFATQADVDTVLGDIDAELGTANDAAAAFGTAQKQIDIQSEFVGNFKAALKEGIGAMVDADMEEASARLAALQTQQQLGIQALTIANQAPQNILSLFR